MRIEIDKLAFLKQFNSCKSSTSLSGDKTFISFDGKDATFIQAGVEVILVKKIKGFGGEPFSMAIATDTLYKIYSTLKETDTIILSETSIEIEGRGQYAVETFHIVKPDIDTVLANPGKKYTLSDMNDLSICSAYTGNANDGFDICSLQQNHYVSSDRSRVFISKTDNKLPDTPLYIPVIVAKALSSYTSVDVYIDGRNWVFHTQDGIWGIVPTRNAYKLPDVFSPQIQSLIGGEREYILVEKEEIKDVLSRMSIFVASNPDTKIEITPEKSYLKIEDNYHKHSEDKVNILMNKADNVPTLKVSCRYLQSAISNINDTKIKISFGETVNSPIVVSNQDGSMQIVIVVFK